MVARFCHLLAHRPKNAGQRGTAPAKLEPNGRILGCKIMTPVWSVRVRSPNFLLLDKSRTRSRFRGTQRACREETWPNWCRETWRAAACTRGLGTRLGIEAHPHALPWGNHDNEWGRSRTPPAASPFLLTSASRSPKQEVGQERQFP